MGDTLDGLGIDRPRPTRRRKQHLCLDKGYDYAEPRRLAAAFGFALHLRTRGEEANAKRRRGAKARRWVVEVAHSWTNRFRDLQIRWCKKPENYLALTHFGFGSIAQAHPVRTRQRMAFKTSRMSTRRGLPTPAGLGRNGSTADHSSPVRSLR